MALLRHLLFFVFFVGLPGVSAFAEGGFQVPRLSGPVMDLANVLSPRDFREIEDRIRNINAEGRAQIQVLTMPNLAGLSIEEASIKIVDEWKLGDAKKDNGLLLLVAMDERRIRIEVGQGLEGIIPDVVAKRITSQVIIPYFKQQIPSQGIVQGVDQIIKIISGEIPAELVQRQSKSNRFFGLPPQLLIFIFFFMAIILRNIIMPRSLGRAGYGRGMGGYGGGWYGGGTGGSSGGGWSGGGGGFSGGGASDGW